MISSPAFSHHDLAVMCNRVYDKPDCELLTVQETDALVLTRGDVTCLAFRGTQARDSWPRKWSRDGLSNTRDVIRDLRFWPWRDPISRQWCHKGFSVSAWWWFDKFHRQLDQSSRYVITGHSLGAGIAPMVARMMVMSGFKVAECVVFGEPKGHYFGSERDYAECDIPTVSYRNKKDWIRFAGFGSTSVPHTELDPGPLSAGESHGVEVYAGVLANARTARE